MSLRILQIYKDYPPVIGGIEGHLRDLSEGLARRGHAVTALVTSPDGRTGVERPLPGLTVARAARALHVASTPLSPAMLGLARAARADVVHLHFPYPPGDLAALLVPGGPPLVVTYHSDIVRQRNLLRAYRPLLRHTLGRAARIIATSPASIETSPFLRPHAAKCVVVPLGVDTGRFAPRDEGRVTKDEGESAAAAMFAADAAGIRHGKVLPSSKRPPSTPVVLFVGRLRYYKGLHVLLDALPGLECAVWIAGSGPERRRLEARAVARGLGGRVAFLGDVSEADLPALYRAADIFVLPAHLRAEAFGIAQLEAMASGLPCVSTELGTGTSFANRHGETGLVVPPGDPQALAAALHTLIADAGLRARYGAAARRRVLSHFTTERMVAGVAGVYAAL